MRRAGLSLPELLVCIGLLSLISLILFGGLAMGTSAFRRAVQRQGEQSDARRMVAAMDVDLRLTDYSSVQVIDDATRQSAAGEPRHAVCVCAVDRWDRPDLFDSAHVAPKWNQYVAFYATTEPEGRLLRTVLRPANVNLIGNFPLVSFRDSPANYLNNNPASNAAPQIAYRQIMGGVRNFELGPAPNSLALRVRLKVLGPAQRQEARPVLEMMYDFFPENSKPRR